MGQLITEQKEKKSLYIYILSEMNLHNELLAYVIQKEFSSPVKLIEHIDSIPKETDNLHNTNFILIDCVKFSFEYVLKHITVSLKSFHSSNYLAIFNLNYGSGVEKIALGKHITGFFYKNDNLNMVIKGIEKILQGDIWISRDILTEFAFSNIKQKLYYIQKNTNLTQREIEILRLLSIGGTNEEIAKKKFITLNTVKTHLYNIYKKINVKNRLQAIFWADKNL
jgi:LuxR family transcriptional regulator, positive regulator of biofilm formation